MAYAGASPDLLFVAATEGVADLERFAAEISSWVRDLPPK